MPVSRRIARILHWGRGTEDVRVNFFSLEKVNDFLVVALKQLDLPIFEANRTLLVDT